MTNKDLRITKSVVTKILIEGADRLDPITVFLEDIKDGVGKITVSCFGRSWTAGWSAMGKGCTVSEFFCDANSQYIIGYFSPNLRGGRYSAEKTAIAAKRQVIKLRKDKEITYSKARDLFESLSSIEEYETIQELHMHFCDQLYEIWGGDWWYCCEEEPNPDYKYLERIVVAVQDALRLQGVAA